MVVNNKNGCQDSSENYKVSNVVGIPSVNWENQVQLYPNPSENIFYIKAPAPVSIKVFDMQGRVVLQREEVKQFNLSGYAKGMYNIVITDKEGRFWKMEKTVVGF